MAVGSALGSRSFVRHKAAKASRAMMFMATVIEACDNYIVIHNIEAKCAAFGDW
jgi:hypothetical protein